jgi:hypothetical protein
MGSSFVEYKGRGFWSWDGYLEHLLFLLAEAIGQSRDESWLNEARDHWQQQSLGFFGGWIHPQLDDYATNTERRSVILGLLGDIISNPDVAEEARETADLMRRLLLGEIKTDASSPLDYMVSGKLPYEWCRRRDAEIVNDMS